jgi:hypothetical protein
MTQRTTKFIQDDAVTGAKILLRNNETLRAFAQDGTTKLDLMKLTTANVLEFQRIPQLNGSLSMPSAPKDLVTVEYITNFVAGKTDPKDAVNFYSDVNVPLTGSTPLVVDSGTLTDGMRLGLGNQTTGIQNGVYNVAISGGTYTLTRSTDFDQVADPLAKEVTSGAYFKIISGTVYSGWEAIVSNADPIVIGTDVLSFTLNPTVQALSGGDMITKSGNTLSVDLASLGGLESTNPGNVSGQLRVKVDTAALEKDQTTRRDPTTGAIVAKKPYKQTVTLTATDITNGYVDATVVLSQGSVQLWVAGGDIQQETVDFTVNYTGGAGSKTRVTFVGGLAVGGVSALVAGDIIEISGESW